MSKPFPSVLVLGGGPDAEREVSLESSQAVADALRAAGFGVRRVLIERATLDDLRSSGGDVVFPVLHGPWGEGGPLQTLLETLGKPYVGSGPTAARRAMDKLSTKLDAAKLGIPTLPAAVLNTDDDHPPLPLPVIIKPVHEGSTIGLHVCKDAPAWSAAIAAIRAQRATHAARTNMVEQAVLGGRELTVGVLDGNALPIIEIVPERGLYDYEAKYKSERTRYVLDPRLTDREGEDLTPVLKTHAERIVAALGVRHLARVDFLLDPAGACWLLEVNTMPGFTSHSLFPMAARHAGMDFPALAERLVRLAIAGLG
jgi:D-alanine-D-alanine ligase